MAEHVGVQLPAPLDRMAEALAGAARATQFCCSTVRQAMTKEERRQELEAIRSEVGGSRRIADLYHRGFTLHDADMQIPGSFVQAMISHILGREFPEDAT